MSVRHLRWDTPRFFGDERLSDCLRTIGVSSSSSAGRHTIRRPALRRTQHPGRDLWERGEGWRLGEPVATLFRQRREALLLLPVSLPLPRNWLSLFYRRSPRPQTEGELKSLRPLAVRGTWLEACDQAAARKSLERMHAIGVVALHLRLPKVSTSKDFSKRVGVVPFRRRIVARQEA